jgi:hypothetical protein
VGEKAIYVYTLAPLPSVLPCAGAHRVQGMAADAYLVARRTRASFGFAIRSQFRPRGDLNFDQIPAVGTVGHGNAYTVVDSALCSARSISAPCTPFPYPLDDVLNVSAAWGALTGLLRTRVVPPVCHLRCDGFARSKRKPALDGARAARVFIDGIVMATLVSGPVSSLPDVPERGRGQEQLPSPASEPVNLPVDRPGSKNAIMMRYGHECQEHEAPHSLVG